uniref:Transcriptional regulator ATRX n=1 Tax=Panagrolaimus sp. PS1159 TaxID=55785 RepID=A0AC35GBS8_9BILA
MEESGYVNDGISSVSAIKVSEESNGINSETSEQLDTTSSDKVIDLTEVYSPRIYFKDASHFLKDKKELQNKAVSTKMERRKKDKPVCITIDSSSDEDDIEVKSSASSEYKPDTRESSVQIDDDDDKSNSDSESPKPSKRKKSAVNSSDEGSIIIDDSDEEITAKKTKSNKRRRVVLYSDEDSDFPYDDDKEEMDSSQKVRTRRIKTRDELEKETVNAEEAEKERKKRLLERQKEFNGIEYETVVTEDGISLVKVLKNLILDNDSKNKNPKPVAVHPSLVRVLKSHQAEGIQFMYDCAFESLEQFRDGNDGGGGILAHCMGLGKTLQVIAFLHTILNHKEISKEISKVLVVVPKNVVLNWRNEFEKWLGSNDHRLESFTVYELDSFKEDRDRLFCLKNWKEEEGPSVMIIGYDMFRILTQAPEDRVVKKRSAKPPPKPKKLSKKQKKFQTMQVEFRKYLQNPGPDLVVLDEAHKLKNDESLIARTMVKIQTRRRICLTGTPLQNNLKEYYVMVSFVKPNLLGTMTEFKNQFANIIERGRTKDATDFEVKLMRRRCFVLYNRLDKIVQRKDISVLKESIPGKMEYVLNEAERKRMLQEDGDSINDFIADDDDVSEASGSDLGDLDSGNSDIEEGDYRRGTRQSKRLNRDKESSPVPSILSLPPEEINGWWSDVVKTDDRFNLEMSNKLVILFDIIKRCEAIGDKLLVFSQSLESLKLIRNFLEYYDKNDKWFVDGHECLAAYGEKWGWKKGDDFLCIDGSVSSADRENIQQRFNKKTNFRARLMLISTRAGSLGTNMVAANRVVIFDCCWNPSHDTQSLFRVYRIGQTKPVYIYRLIAAGTMEECIYKRQVTKDSVAMRVVDEAQIQRHFHNQDLEELYTLSHTPYYENDPKKVAPPKDRLLADLILANPSAVVNFIFHDNLFENIDGEKLTPDEIEEAWNEYARVKANPNGDHAMLMQMQHAAILQANPALNAQPSHAASNSLAAILALSQMQNNLTFNSTPNNPQANNHQKGQVNGIPVDPALARLITSDNIYHVGLNCGLNAQQSTYVAYIKMITHILLEKMPPELRGGVVEIGSTITDILYDNSKPAQDKTRQVLNLFQTLVTVFRKNMVTSNLLDHYTTISPWLIPSRVVLPHRR